MNEATVIALGQCNLYKLNGSALQAPLYRYHPQHVFITWWIPISSTSIQPSNHPIQPPFRSPEKNPREDGLLDRLGRLGSGANAAGNSTVRCRRRRRWRSGRCSCCWIRRCPRQKKRWVWGPFLLWGAVFPVVFSFWGRKCHFERMGDKHLVAKGRWYIERKRL